MTRDDSIDVYLRSLLDDALPVPEHEEGYRQRVSTLIARHGATRTVPWWRRLRGRTLAVLVAGAVLLGGGAVYAGDYVANAPAQGELVWKFKAAGGVATLAAVSDGVVYFGSRDGHLYAVDAQSGQERWEFQADGVILSKPAVADGVVYFGGGGRGFLRLLDLHLYALDAQSGQERWRFKPAGGQRVSSPAVADGVVYFADNRYLYAVDVQSGAERWRFQADGRRPEPLSPHEELNVLFSPAVSDGVVYVGGNDTYLYAVDAQSGQTKWKFHAGGGFYGGFWSSVVISGGVVYISNDDGYLHALDAQSGQERWKFKTGHSGGSSPAISGGVVYVANDDDKDGYLHALDIQSGQEKWVFRAGEALRAGGAGGTPHRGANWWDDPPAISGGLVYFGGNDGYLHGLDAQSGQEKWKFETGYTDVPYPPAGRLSSAVSNGVVYVGSADGYLYAVK